MDFPSVLDSLLVFPPDECSTPTSPSFLHDTFNNESCSLSHTTLDHTASSSNDFSSYHDPWAGYPSGDYVDYDGAQGNLMGVDLRGMAGGTGGATLELMDIAPLPGLVHSAPEHHSYQYSNPPSFCPSTTYNPAFDPYHHSQSTATTSGEDDNPSPSPSSQYSSLPRTPPSITLHHASAHDSSNPSVSKRARRESSVNPYASTAGSSYAGSPEPESMRTLGDLDEHDLKKGDGGASNGKGKKRKQLPTTAEFQHPDVSGLTKKEARLVKNRAAAFLSRQRKREQFDELEIQCTALVVENNQLKSLLAAKASSAPTALPLAPKVTKRQAAALAAAASASAAPQVDPAQLSALQSDLANLRTLLHASTAREAALEVEMASLRAQLGGLPSGVTVAPSSSSKSLSPMLSGGLIPDPEQAVTGAQQESGVVVGGRRGVVGRGPKDREGKRVGGVALMVILFSFALFSLPPGTITNLPLRASSPTTSSFPFASLGRVLQAGGPGAGFPAAIERQVLSNDDSPSTAEDVDMGVCEMDGTHHANGTESSSSECFAEEKRRSSTASSASATAASFPSPPVSKDLSHWSFPTTSLDLASSAGSDSSRRSFSLTLLRPIPSSPAPLQLTHPTDGVEGVLERWLGLSLFDQVGPSPVAAEGSFGDDEPGGWFVVDSSEQQEGTTTASSPVEEQQEHETAPKAWDGSTLERMELDEVVLGLAPSSPSPSGSSRPKAASYLTLPSNPSEDALGSNDTFVRLDLELEVGVRRREVAIVGREEVRGMMMMGKGRSLPGSWVV